MTMFQLSSVIFKPNITHKKDRKEDEVKWNWKNERKEQQQHLLIPRKSLFECCVLYF
jgi:hypothetical protein